MEALHPLRGSPIAPMGGQPQDADALLPNLHLRDAIEEWRNRQPLAINPDLLQFADPEELLGRGSFGMVVGGTLQTHGQRLRVAIKMLTDMTLAQQRTQFEK